MLVFRALCSGATFSQWICLHGDVKNCMVKMRERAFYSWRRELLRCYLRHVFTLLPTHSYYLYKAPKGEFGCSLTRYLPLDLTACLCSNRRLHIQWNSFWYASLMKKKVVKRKNIHLPNTISAAGSFVPSPFSQWSREKISSSAFWAF